MVSENLAVDENFDYRRISLPFSPLRCVPGLFRGPEGARVVADALQVNKTVHTISFSRMRIALTCLCLSAFDALIRSVSDRHSSAPRSSVGYRRDGEGGGLL